MPKWARHAVRACVLISGRGSNMGALIRGADGYTVEAVISNKLEAAGIALARDLGVRCAVEPSLDGIAKILDGLKPDLVCMAGFMRILPAEVTERHTIMNIHPSLLPRYPGLYAVRQAIEDGATYTGCTVHFADAGVDTGRIISQAVVQVEPGDTEEKLAARILEREHVLYVEAVRWYASVLGEGRNSWPPAGRAGRKPVEHPTRAGEPRLAAAYAAGCGRVVYVRPDGGAFVVVHGKPVAPPYVAAAPGDDMEVVMARIGRLAAAPRRGAGRPARGEPPARADG